jgi:hypothetical protein
MEAAVPFPRNATTIVLVVLVWISSAPALAAPVLRDGGALTFDDKGAKVGEQLPDLTVYTLEGKPTAFSKAWGGVVMTASLTCPKSREKYPDLQNLTTSLGGKGHVAILYVIEAHPDRDLSPYKGIIDVTPANQRDGILFRQPTTLEDRLKLARAFHERFKIPSEIEVYVDGMSNEAWRQVGGGPNMGLVVGQNGVVWKRQGWFDAATLKPDAEAFASRKPASGSAAAGLTLADPALQGNKDEVDAILATVRGGGQGTFIVAGPPQLQEALLYNRGEIAKDLLAADHPTNAFSSAALGEVSVVKKYIDADPTIARRRDGAGRDLLDYASAGGRIEVVKLLLSRGVNDERPPGGTKTSALHWAARNGRTSVAALLLDEAGSDANAKDFTGRTPIDLAEEAAKAPGAPSSAAATLDLLKAAAGKPVKPAKVVTPPPPASSSVPVP